MSSGRSRTAARQAKAREAAADARAARIAIAVAATALVTAGLVALGLAAQAGAARDRSASAFLAGALKPAMQQTLRKSVPGIAVSKVTCFVPSTSTTIQGKCTAAFTVAKFGLKGKYQANAKLASNGRLTWSATGRTCSDLRGRRASCTGQTNTGNGMISAGLAERQLLANGLVYQQAKVKLKTAICQGLKSAKWKHGNFDDVYAQLRCSVRATSGGSYSLVFRMVGADGYNLTNVTRR
jgi:hypothetical protein